VYNESIVPKQPIYKCNKHKVHEELIMVDWYKINKDSKTKE
jgi:hypothetical protein